MLKSLFSFKGRIPRSEYVENVMIFAVSVLLISRIMESYPDAIFLNIGYIPFALFIIAKNAKRCHDLGNSGWYQIIPLYIFWLLFQDSQNGINAYGINPKGIGNQPNETNSSD